MSAFIVDKEHILYLVEAASQYNTYFQTKSGNRMRNLSSQVEVANLLWKENVLSVNSRYDEKSDVSEITSKDFRVVRWNSFSPVQVIKAVKCYEYQSCEHDGWVDSKSKVFCEALKDDAINELEGYEKAEWGCPPISVR